MRAEFRASFEHQGKSLRGYAAVYGVETRPEMQLREMIDAGAFDTVLASADLDVPLLVGHRDDALLARTSSGTLRLSTDKRGLVIDADLPDTTLGRDTAELVSRGDLRHMSFGFIAGPVEWRAKVRHVRSIDALLDVSLVTNPAYLATEAQLRRLETVDFDGYAELRKRQLTRIMEEA